MSYKTDLQANNAKLQSNNTDLQAILDTVNTLPEGGGGVTKITVKASYADTIKCYDMVKKTFVSISSDGTAISVTDHLVIYNIVDFTSSVIPELVYKNGERDFAKILVNSRYKGSYGVVYFEILGVGPVAKEDIDYIYLTAMPD